MTKKTGKKKLTAKEKSEKLLKIIEKEQNKVFTAWHVYLAYLLLYRFDSDCLKVYPFLKLGKLPIETDFFVIKMIKNITLVENLGKLPPHKLSNQ